MSSRRELDAKPGDWVLIFWDRLGKWIDSLRVIAGPDVRVSESPHGTTVIPLPPPVEVVPFQAVYAQRKVRISAGRLAGLRPMIGGAFIDGFAADNVTPATVPWLPLDPTPPKGQTESWIVIHPPVKGQDGTLAAPLITHELKLSDQYQELALVVWKDGTPLRVVQIVRHDLNYQVGKAAASPAITSAAETSGQAVPAAKARVFFWGV